MTYVYILRCAGDSLYIGHTNDLERRLSQHNDGRGAVFTARRRPVALVYSESQPTLSAAIERECQMKRWTRAKKEALIAGDLQLLKKL